MKAVTAAFDVAWVPERGIDTFGPVTDDATGAEPPARSGGRV